MATTPCPSCGLPRADDLFGVVACPLCGHAGVLAPAREPVMLPPEPALTRAPEHPKNPPARPGRRLAVGLALGFLVGTASGAGGAFAWQAYREQLPAAGAGAVADPPAPAATSDIPLSLASPAPVGPAPRPAPAPGIAPPSAPEPAPSPRAKEPVVVGPPPQPAPPNPFRPAAPRAMRIDGAEDYSPLVEPGSTLTVRGSVKRLIVNDLVGGAVLDCSELDAREVVVIGKLDGRARLAVSAPGGTVTFRAPVGGGAAVDVTARAVEFRGRIDGAGTKVAVTLTAGGTLAFAALDGPARLEYAKADPNGPDPAVVRGTVGGQAVFAKVE